jgi:molybdopterin-guanine dinucleotide biosynthesis protein A
LTPKIKPYILAGGKSSRMGRDKAMLELEGKTLLARAVETLRSVKELQLPDGSVEVTICGEREELEGADRAIVDRYPSCGPLGGIEAALNDLATRENTDWAFFIPVDMPLLSGALIGQLLTLWIRESLKLEGVRACLVKIHGTPQPLVSLVHRSVLRPVREALDLGRYKVVPVLQSSGASCTSFDQEPPSLDRTREPKPSWVSVNRFHLDAQSQEMPRSEWRFSGYLDPFINVNTETDLGRVATLLRQKGSHNQPEPAAR